METTEKIVEAYVRYLKGWATIPNVQCLGKHEVDLLAINPRTNEKYHIEVSISISGSFSKLTAHPFDPEKYKDTRQKPSQRRTLDYFIERKFNSEKVTKTLENLGFKKGQYKKVIVSWGWKEDVKQLAEQNDIELWDFRVLMEHFLASLQNLKMYFADDTLRTLHLFSLAIEP